MGENSHLCNSGQVLTLTFKLNCSVGWKKLSYGTSLAGIVKFRNQFRKSCKLLPTWLKMFTAQMSTSFLAKMPIHFVGTTSILSFSWYNFQCIFCLEINLCWSWILFACVCEIRNWPEAGRRRWPLKYSGRGYDYEDGPALCPPRPPAVAWPTLVSAS